MPQAGRQSKSLRRQTGARQLGRRYLVYCEGKITERQYLDAVKQELRNAGVEIVVGPRHGEPLGLVEAASSHAGRVGRRVPQGFDEVWCVIDVEAPMPHGSLMKAIALAEARNIRCAISNPCFELWLLLHFDDHTSHLTTDGACRLLESRDHCGYTVAGKRFNVAAALPLKDLAAERARRLAQRHGDIPLGERNPGSDFHLLLDSLRTGSPRP